ncbi:MAG: hypothetical protein VW667_03950 [Candidatus Neomarinimicrobiota bacterium]|jgi:hypothetical protein
MNKTIKVSSSTYELLNKLSRQWRLTIDATMDKIVVEAFNTKSR